MKLSWSQKLLGISALCLALFFVIFGNSFFPTRQRTLPITSEWLRPLATSWELQSPGKQYSVAVDSNLKENGQASLRFELRGGEKWVDKTFMSSYRSEVATRYFPPAGTVKWYSFSVYFPTNFPIEDNRLVFAQWHDRSKLFDAQLIPPLAFRYVKGKLSITLRHSTEKSIRDPDAVPSEDLFKKGHFHQGRWQDFVVQVKWSCRDDGFVNVWWNGDQIVDYRGAVGYDEPEGPQFKFGLYRDATDSTYVAYFSHVKIGDSAKEIDFDPASAKTIR